LRSVADISGDAPGIAGQGIVLRVADFQKDVPFHKVAGLLIRVAVLRQDVVFIEKEFGHQGSAAVTKCLLPDTLNGFFVAIFALFAKNNCHLSLP